MQTIALPQTPTELRNLIRRGDLVRPTAGMAPGFVQANLVILPKDLAFDFMMFCQRNPKPCPLLEVVESGSPEPSQMAPGADLRKDVGKYRIYKNGAMIDEPEDISDIWTEDLVSFLIGCSFTFEAALLDADIPLRHIDQGSNVSMYITSIQTAPAGAFSGPMVVSMRPIKQDKVIKAVTVTTRYPSVHGAPIHIGNPESIGIQDITTPDIGDPTDILDDEVPVFWACGVTPQAVAMNSKPSLMITHSPGHMFITDSPDEKYSVL